MGWQRLKLGAGGQLTGIDIQPDGTMVVRADTYGCYWWNASASKWIQLTTASSMPSPSMPDEGYNLPYGGFEIRIAPSNTQRFYKYLTEGHVYTTTNRGVSWTQTNFTQTGADGNADSKFFGPYMAVDPNDELTCFVGTPSSGVFFTKNGGTSFTPISTATVPAGVATGSGGSILTGNQIAFHPTTANLLYINSWGNGVYKSTDGGTTWAALPAAPTTDVLHIAVDSAGKVYLGKDGTGTSNIYVFDGTWHSYSTGAKSVQNFAIDPANNNNVAAVSVEGNLSITSSGVAAGWSGYGTLPTRVAADIPWLGNIPDAFMTTSGLAYGPSSTIYLAAGIGVWKYSGGNWNSQSLGIEQLVTDWIISPPGGNPAAVFFDRPIYTITNPNAFPTQYGPYYSGSVLEGYSCDWASSSPSNLIMMVTDNGASGFGPSKIWHSSNGGGSDGGPSNWTVSTGGLPVGNNGGTVAASTPLNWAVIAQGGGLMFTTDGGANWAASVTGIATPDPDQGWGGISSRDKIQNLCADRVLSNTFYAYNAGVTQPGFYVSTNSGANFVYKSSAGGNMGASSIFNPQIRSVPGVSGNFYANPCAGIKAISVPAGNGFYELQWNGTTLTKTTVTGVTDVWGHGFGKAKPGGSGYPSVYLYGTISGQGRGLFRSDDHCSTWTLLTQFFPCWDSSGALAGTLDEPTTIEGDSNTYGTVYVGFNGSGIAMFSLDNTPVITFPVIHGHAKKHTRMIAY